MAPPLDPVSMLRAWIALDPKHRKQSAIARRLGVKPPTVWAWLAEHSRPEGSLRELLEVLTDGAVPAAAWVTDADRAKRAAALERIHEHPIDNDDTIPPSAMPTEDAERLANGGR